MLVIKQKNSPVIQIGSGILSGATDKNVGGAESESPGVARSLTSEALLGERGELKIQHNGEQYSLRRTRHGKLILTK